MKPDALCRLSLQKMPQDDENVTRIRKQLDAVTDKLQAKYNAVKEENA